MKVFSDSFIDNEINCKNYGSMVPFKAQSQIGFSKSSFYSQNSSKCLYNGIFSLYSDSIILFRLPCGIENRRTVV